MRAFKSIKSIKKDDAITKIKKLMESGQEVAIPDALQAYALEEALRNRRIPYSTKEIDKKEPVFDDEGKLKEFEQVEGLVFFQEKD